LNPRIRSRLTTAADFVAFGAVGRANYGQCSDRFSALAQAWIFLAIVNHENDFIGRHFYRDPGVVLAHVEMYGEAVYLPLISRDSP
jgi:hypothetical protein